MTSRIPSSRRDPEFAPQRAARALASQVPGAGRIAGVARPGVSSAVAAALRGRPAGGMGGLSAGNGVYLDTVIKQGPAGVATNVFPAGTRVPASCTTTVFYARCNPSHLPSGSSCTVLVKRSGTTIATISISAGASTGSVSTAAALSAGDLLTYDFTAVGSTTPAWDVAVGIEAV
jgi:hypothetical protein